MTEAESKTHKPRTTRPALDVLDHDQDRLLYHGHAHRDPPIRAISDGFRSHLEVLTWYQAAGIRTLGHVERVIEPRHILPLSDLFEYLIADQGQAGEYVRMRVVEALNDACDLAYREFRERANERVEDEQASSWKDVDPESEQNPLMRPAFRRLDRSQAGALIGFVGRVRGPTGGRAVGSVADGVDARRDAGPVPRLDRLVADAPRGARRPGVGGVEADSVPVRRSRATAAVCGGGAVSHRERADG